MLKAHGACDAPIELRDLRMIAVEEIEEAGLRARRAFDPPKPHRRDPVQQLLGIQHEFLHPERDALADGRELRRLKMGVSKARERAVAARVLTHGDEHRSDAAEQELHRLPHHE